MTPGDREHLPGDIERAYVSLISEWLAYMQHLKKYYPYPLLPGLAHQPFALATPEKQHRGAFADCCKGGQCPPYSKS